jgi:hypothetical protein
VPEGCAHTIPTRGATRSSSARLQTRTPLHRHAHASCACCGDHRTLQSEIVLLARVKRTWLKPLFRQLWSRLWQTGAAALCAGTTPSCANEYPIPPTFCDDFCRATLRRGCDTEPENCVRECELQPIGPQCVAKQHALLGCYQAADDDAFQCSGVSGTRVLGGVCQDERDALLICELPAMDECLELCRPYQAVLDERLQSPVDAGITENCALLRQSCEGICWNLLSIGTLDVEDAPGTASGPIAISGRVTLRDAAPAELISSIVPLLDGCGL